jgi:ferric-dicitrate binding protein FerR (iron transport regulator)
MQDDLMVRYFNEELTQSEKEELFACIEADPALKKEFVAMQNVCALSSLLRDESDEMKSSVRFKQFKQRRRVKTVYASLRQFAGYAAVILMAAFTTWFVMKNHPSTEDTNRPPLVYEEISVPSGQRAMVKLQDGTTVWINARSSLRYPTVFAANERRVELNGEAFFDVAEQNDKQPFIVSTEKVDVMATGTQFNVFAYAGRNNFKTSLITGIVEIYNAGQEDKAICLKPNESAELISDRWVKKSFGNKDFLLWKEGIYAFDDMPFAEIIQKLELYYDTTILIEHQKLSTYKFTGKFRQRDGLVSVLHTLQKIYHFTFTKDDEKNIITIRQ